MKSHLNKFQFCVNIIFNWLQTINYIFAFRFRFIIKTFKQQYTLLNCKLVMSAGSQASEFFLNAQNLYTQQEQQQGRFTEIELDFARQPDPANIPGLLGVITTSLMVIELLLGSCEFREETKKLIFLDHVLNPSPESEEKVQLYFLPKMWVSHGSYISNLYIRTSQCFAIAARKFCYTFNSNDMKSFSEQATKCQKLLGNVYLKEQIEQNQDCKTQLRFLRRFFAAGLVQSFGHLLVCPSRQIDNFSNLMIQFQSIVDANANLSFTPDDKVSYLNLYFALQYHSDCKTSLSRELATKFSADVCKCKDLSIPEPLLFCLILNWPFQSNANSETAKQISETIDKLRRFERKINPNFNSRQQQLAPLFLVGKRENENDLSVDDCDIVSPKKILLRKRFEGFYDNEKREVQLKIGKNEILSIRPDSKSKLRHSSQVSFSVGFTLAGPVACDVIDITHNLELARAEGSVKIVEKSKKSKIEN